MNKLDLVYMGLKNLWRRKLRTSLTILGVVIGASAIIIMVSLGLGLEKSFEEQLMSMEDLTSISIRKPYSFDGKTTDKKQKQALLDDEAVAKFKKMKNVVTVSPTLSDYGIIATSGKNVLDTQIIAMDPEAMQHLGLELETGRLLNPNDKDAILLGSEAAYGFRKRGASSRYDNPEKRKPVNIDGKFIFTFDYNYGYQQTQPFEEIDSNQPKYKEYKVNVVGILKESNDWEMSYAAIMPIKTFEKYKKEKLEAERLVQSGSMSQQGRDRNSKHKYDNIKIKVSDIKYVEEINETLKAQGYQTYTSIEYLNQMKKTTGMIQAVLGAIGAVSLIIAAIGITNTMVMSIYERTKEIGVMKVIGASIEDIRNLFLFEATMIGGLGGIIGAIFSSIVSFAANRLATKWGIMERLIGGGMDGAPPPQLSYIPPWLIIIGIAISAGIGIIAGFLPARRAMKLSALEAIRTE